LIFAFFTRFKAILSIGIIFGILLFFAFKIIIPFLLPPKHLIIGIPGRFTPSTLPSSIGEMVGNGLTKLSPNGNPVPDLALSWETTDKGKTWIFRLDDKKTWQDGKKVTSDSISYEFSDVKIERPDDKTLVFKLQNSYSAFPTVVSRPVFKKGLLGTGKWTVRDLSLAGSYIDKVTLENADKQQIIYKFYPTEERTKVAFELGQVSEIQNIVDPSPLTAWRNIKSEKIIDKGEFVAIFFNNQDKILAEKNIRQALSYAIDKQALSDERTISPISSDSWAYNSQVKPYNYDLVKAKQMVDEYKKESKLDKISVSLTATSILLPQAELIKKNWQAVGVETEIKVETGIPESYQAFMAILDIPDDPDQYSLWHSTQIESGTNITKYNDPRIDKLLEGGRSELDQESRRKIYLDFQRYLLEDAPAAFLYYPAFYKVSRN